MFLNTPLPRRLTCGLICNKIQHGHHWAIGHMLATVSLHVEATINASRTLKVAEARRWTLNLKRRSREAASRYMTRTRWRAGGRMRRTPRGAPTSDLQYLSRYCRYSKAVGGAWRVRTLTEFLATLLYAPDPKCQLVTEDPTQIQK